MHDQARQLNLGPRVASYQVAPHLIQFRDMGHHHLVHYIPKRSIDSQDEIHQAATEGILLVAPNAPQRVAEDQSKTVALGRRPIHRSRL